MSGIKLQRKAAEKKGKERKTLSLNRPCGVSGQKKGIYCFNPVSRNLLIPCCEHHRSMLDIYIYIFFLCCLRVDPHPAGLQVSANTSMICCTDSPGDTRIRQMMWSHSRRLG